MLLTGPHPYGIVVVEDLTERRKIEERLQQSQRLESVGRLAGGIAHDFNNLLTAISGYSELLLAGLERGDPRREDASEISLAAMRAAALTRQLLRFARRQQPEPTDVDLDGIVRGIEPMLTRLLGEGVELRLMLSGGSLVRADPGQLEQVVVNLVLNGRDAMPDGGLISIETAADESEVLLRVRDSGLGMDEEVRAQVFEPFFTTKSESEGTGLGLATVF
ncbi:MAG: sensor histidine kinase [Gaiellaceae bacterium]